MAVVVLFGMAFETVPCDVVGCSGVECWGRQEHWVRMEAWEFEEGVIELDY